MIDNFPTSHESANRTLAEIGTAGFTLALDLKLNGPVYFYSCYPQPWQDEYRENNYLLGDPIVLWFSKGAGYCRWTEIGFPDFRNIFKRAANFNINYGAVFSSRFGKKRSFMTVARQDRELTDVEMNICNDIFNILLAEAFSGFELTQPELEYLNLLSLGCEQQEIAKQLCLSNSGIKYRAKKVLEKLGAKNKPHAILIAKDKKLI